MSAGPRTQFIQIPIWVLRHPKVASVEGGTILRVYASLLAQSTYKTRVARIPVTAVMEETGLSQSMVYRAVATLREIGAVQTRCNGELWLPMDDPSDSMSVETDIDDSTTVESDSTTVESHLSYIDRSIETLPTPLVASLPATRSDLIFEQFWEIYPRHTARGAAQDAWRKRVNGNALDVLERARCYALDPNLPEPQFIPHASTWLNQRRWEDGPLPPRGPQSMEQRTLTNLDQWLRSQT